MLAKRDFVENLRLKHLKHLNPVFYASSTVGLFPLNVLKENFSQFRPFKCYCVLVMAFILAASVDATLKKLKATFFFQTTATTMDLMSLWIFTVSSIYCVYSNVFVCPSKIRSVIEKLVEVDTNLSKINVKRAKRKNVLITLVFQHLMAFSIIFCNVAWFETGGKRYVNHHYVEDVEFYHAFTVFSVISNFFVELKLRFDSVNLCLRSFQMNRARIDGRSVQVLTITYGILTEIIDLYNDLFGWEILLMFIYALISLLAPLNIIAIFIPRQADVLKDGNFNTAWFIVVILNTTIFIIQNFILIAKYSHHLYKNQKETACLCYRLLHNINDRDKQLKENLLFLAQEATLRSPQISASGFFNVDYTMIFLLFTSLTTYVVVLIQFNL